MDEEAMATCSSSESVLVVPPAKILKAVSAVSAAGLGAAGGDGGGAATVAAVADGTLKNSMIRERMSPASVDSGFDSSSFPPSPDCSLDSAHGTVTATTTTATAAAAAAIAAACAVSEKNDPCLKEGQQTAIAACTDHNANVAVVLPCSLPLCQPSCSSSLSPITISRTSVEITTLSTSFTAANTFTTTGPKTTDEFCVDAHLLEKTSPPQRPRSSSLPLLPSQATNEVEKKQPEVLSTSASDSNVAELPECSSLPSSSELSVKLNECDLGIPCRWSNCLERFQHDNDLYDHVVKAHLKPLRPSEDPSSTGSDNLQSTPTKGRVKNLMCQWGNCKMGLSRGDIHKQFIWLEEHFTTRHAGKAQPYMCLIEGCTLRFTLKRALEEHLRTGHEKAKAKRAHMGGRELLQRRPCLRWTPMPYYPSTAESDFMDRSVDEWIVMRLRQYERTNNPSFVVREPATPRISGAAHRKRRRILTFAIESDHIAPEIVSESMDLADTKAHCTGVFIGSEECRISNGTAGPIVK